jgi:hypothetical protein
MLSWLLVCNVYAWFVLVQTPSFQGESKQPYYFFVPFGLFNMYSCCYSLLVPSWCSFFSLQLNAVAVLPVVSTCLGCVYSLSLVSCLMWFQGSLSPTNQVYGCSWTVPSHCCALSHDGCQASCCSCQTMVVAWSSKPSHHHGMALGSLDLSYCCTHTGCITNYPNSIEFPP